MGKKENEIGGDDTVGTPKYILDAIVATLGPIGLDPTSHPDSIVPSDTAILLPRYAPARVATAEHTVYADGLDVDWSLCGLTYLNPPYSDGKVGGLKAFIERAWELRRRFDHETVMLVPVRTGNVYWQQAAGKADLEVRLPRVTHRGSTTHAPFHQWLLYFGPRVELALGLGVLGDVRVHPRHTVFRPTTSVVAKAPAV